MIKLTPHRAGVLTQLLTALRNEIKSKNLVIKGDNCSAMKITYAIDRTLTRCEGVIKKIVSEMKLIMEMPKIADGKYILEYRIGESTINKEAFDALDDSEKAKYEACYTFESDAVRDEWSEKQVELNNREFDEYPYSIKSDVFSALHENVNGELVPFQNIDTISTLQQLGFIDMD